MKIQRSGKMFGKNVARRSDVRSMMRVGRNVGLINMKRGMTGRGIFDTIKRFISSGISAYQKYKPIAQKAYDVYKNADVQRFVPAAVKQKIGQAEKFGMKHKDKVEAIERIAQQYSKQEREAPMELAKVIAKQPATERAVMPSDSLKQTLLDQIKSQKLKPQRAEQKQSAVDPMADLRAKLASRRAAIEPAGAGLYPPGAGLYPPGAGLYPPGAGLYPPGAGLYPVGGCLHPGAGLYPPGDILGSGKLKRMAKRTMPALIKIIQRGSGMTNTQAKQLLNMTQHKIADMSGGSFSSDLESFADAIVSPLKMISGISGGGLNSARLLERRPSGRTKDQKKILSEFKKNLVKQLKKSQKGTGPSFSDIMMGILKTAGTVLPFLL
jgi:hypothetical protein